MRLLAIGLVSVLCVPVAGAWLAVAPANADSTESPAHAAHVTPAARSRGLPPLRNLWGDTGPDASVALDAGLLLGAAVGLSLVAAERRKPTRERGGDGPTAPPRPVATPAHPV